MTVFSLLTFKTARYREQRFHLHRVHTTQAVHIHYLSQLLPEFLGSKVVDEWIEAAIQAAETESQFVSHVQGLLVEDPQYGVSQQENVVGCKAEDEDQENSGGETDRSLFLGRL